MSMTLRNADARAVDLILDRAVMAQGAGGATVFAAGPGVSNEQIAAVEKVLKLLDVMPVAEPSPDLLRRTLGRVAAGPLGHLPAESCVAVDLTRPMAS